MRRPSYAYAKTKAQISCAVTEKLISAFILVSEKVVVLGFYVPPTAKNIRRLDLGLKSHPKDWRSLGSNPRPLVYKASGLITTLRRLLIQRKYNSSSS